MSGLSWEPRRLGEFFCSPGCGHGCTWDEHVIAKILGKILAVELGEGWKPNVWENLGWHHNAISPCGRVKVHRYSDGRCTAFLGPKESAGGTFTATADTPHAAALAVCQKAMDGIDEIAALLEGLP